MSSILKASNTYHKSNTLDVYVKSTDVQFLVHTLASDEPIAITFLSSNANVSDVMAYRTASVFNTPFTNP